MSVAGRKIRIAISIGDPAGIGPELAVRAAASDRWKDRAELLLYGDPAVIAESVRKFAPGSYPTVVSAGKLARLPAYGVASADCGKAAYETIGAAVKDALTGRVDALVTAPVNKYAVNLAGIAFTGHTEYIAELCGVPEVAMMQSAGSLRIAFVTTHIGLAEVPRAVTRERILRVTLLLDEAIRAEQEPSPCLAVAALNPHAGENGFMGQEDETIVKPALEELRNIGVNVTGPFPPDTLFIPGTREKYDGILAMYHDQGHIPFKMLAFDRGVNSTLGLPIIRTSPDHGTAFEIAGRGIADTGSFYAAIDLALLRAERKFRICTCLEK